MINIPKHMTVIHSSTVVKQNNFLILKDEDEERFPFLELKTYNNHMELGFHAYLPVTYWIRLSM